MAAAFLHGWKMEMVLLLVFPAIAIAFYIKIRTAERHQQRQHSLMQPANHVSKVMLYVYFAIAIWACETHKTCPCSKHISNPHQSNGFSHTHRKQGKFEFAKQVLVWLGLPYVRD
jgi:hypothetical protein